MNCIMIIMMADDLGSDGPSRERQFKFFNLNLKLLLGHNVTHGHSSRRVNGSDWAHTAIGTQAGSRGILMIRTSNSTYQDAPNRRYICDVRTTPASELMWAWGILSQ